VSWLGGAVNDSNAAVATALERVERLTVEAGGEDDPRVFRAAVVLGTELTKAGLSGRAHAMTTTLAVSPLLDGLSAESCQLRRQLIDLLIRLSFWDEVRAQQQLLLGQHAAVFGAGHLRTVGTRVNLATTLARLGDEEAARRQAGEALAVACRLAGPDHPVAAAARTVLSRTG
jgi:hypothetical protein